MYLIINKQQFNYQTNMDKNTDIAYSFYKKVFNQSEFNEIAKWTNDTYYNSDGIYREPKVDTMEERIAFIRQFSGNLTAMAWLNYYYSVLLDLFFPYSVFSHFSD